MARSKAQKSFDDFYDNVLGLHLHQMDLFKQLYDIDKHLRAEQKKLDRRYKCVTWKNAVRSRGKR